MTSSSNDDLAPEPFEPDRRSATPEESGIPGQRGPRQLSPRQARRFRMAVAATLMAVVAVAMIVELSQQSSVLTLGIYGVALILCGVVIELSRRGRTRLGMYLLMFGLTSTALVEHFLWAR